MKKTIADVDFGHGGTDPGSCSYGVKEAEQVLSLKPYLDKSAERYPLLELRYTRTTDDFVSLEDRVKHANRIPADILVSIHMNSFGNSSANGVETWIDYGSTKSPEVANKIHENLVKVGEKGEKGEPGQKGADAVINKLNKVDALASGADAATIVTAFNNLISDLKAKGYMNQE